jgi:hypothetical protein
MTAVTWLLENLISEPYSEADFEHNKECWNKAEELEKKQIMKAVYDSMGTNFDPNMGRAELYYNETFKTEKYNN